MTLAKENFALNSTSLTNIVFSFFPFSFILGNLAININILLFCCLGIFQLRSRILKIKFDFPLKIVFLFFLIIFFSTSLSFIKSLYFEGYEHENLIRLIKSIAFLRFFLLLLIIYILFEFNVLNFKYFLLTATCSSILVALDIIYQYFFDSNIIGLKPIGIYHNTGFFGDELIAGGFIQDFSFFTVLFLAFSFKNKNYIKYIFIISTICILGLGILFSGNRMSLILFLIGLLLIFFFNNELKKIISISLVVLFVLMKLIFSSDEKMRGYYTNLYANTIGQLMLLKDRSKQKKEIKEESPENQLVEKQRDTKAFPQSSFVFGESHRARLIMTALDIWSRNKIFGNGIKSFRMDCQKLFFKNPEYNITVFLIKGKKNRLCSTHPHNYYVEVLTETGLVGLSIMLIIALLFCIFIFKNLKLFKENKIGNFLILSSTVCLILEMFPLQSTGSVFTTHDMAYIILISSFILSYKKIIDDKSLK